MALKEEDRILLTHFSGLLTVYFGRGDMQDFFIEQDATAPVIKFKIRDEDGNIPSAALASATISMWKYKSGTSEFNDQTMTVTSAANWEVEYTFLAAEVNEAGSFLARISPTPTAGTAQPITERIRVVIVKKPPT